MLSRENNFARLHGFLFPGMLLFLYFDLLKLLIFVHLILTFLLFQCCSMEADCESMAVMAATLANGGICPTTEEKVLKSDSVRDVLSLMHSCGMYDYSGQFAFKVRIRTQSAVR